MDSKEGCISCGKRLTGKSKRPVTMGSLRIFISARLYPSRLPNEGFICDKCRWLYKKWVAEFSFCEMLLKFDQLKEDKDIMSEEFGEKRNENDSNDEFIRRLGLYANIQEFLYFY